MKPFHALALYYVIQENGRERSKKRDVWKLYVSAGSNAGAADGEGMAPCINNFRRRKYEFRSCDRTT